MKKLLFFLLSFCIFTIGWAQLTLPVEEDFEDTENLLFENAEGNTTDWVANTTIYNGESGSSFHNAHQTNSNNALVLSDEINLPEGAVIQLSFFHIAKTEGGYDDCLVEITTDNGTTWTPLPATAYIGTGVYNGSPICFDEDAYTDWGTGTLAPTNTWWKQERFSLAAYAGETIKIRFRVTADGSTNRAGWYIDDVRIFEDPCPIPAELATTELSATEATIAWTSPLSSFEVEYKLVTEETWSATETVTDYFCTLYNLSGSTSYDVRVRAACTEGEFSDWAVASFTTACVTLNTEDLPYIQGFEECATGARPNCWSFLASNISGYPKVTATAAAAHTGTKSLQFNAAVNQHTYCATPIIAAGNDIVLSFWLRSESIYGAGLLDVGIMTNATDITTFNKIQTVTADANNVYKKIYVVIPADMQTNDFAVAFRHRSNFSTYELWMDDLEISEMPDCAPAMNFALSNITTDGATVNFIASPYSSLELFLKQITALDEGTVSEWISQGEATTGAILSGLISGAQYQIKIESTCDEDTLTSEIISFSTACDVVNEFPYTLDFEAMPACWTVSPGAQVIISTAAADVYEGTGALSYTTGMATFIAGPSMGMPLGDLSVYFFAQSPNTHPVVIGAVSDPNDYSTFEPIDTIIPTPSYSSYDVALTSYEGTGTHVALKYQGTLSSTKLCIDNLTIQETISCQTPDSLKVLVDGIGTTSLHLDWQDPSETAASFIVEWKVYEEETWNAVEGVTEHPYLLENLPINSAITVRVKAVCADGGVTLPTDTKLYLLNPSPITEFPYVNDFEGTWWSDGGISTPGTSRNYGWENLTSVPNTPYNWKSITTAAYVYEGETALYLYHTSYSTTVDDYMFSPVLSLTGNQRVSFMAKGCNSVSSSYIDSLHVLAYNVSENGDLTGLESVANATCIFATLLNQGADAWQYYEVLMPGLVGDYRIALLGKADGKYLAVDNFTISEIPSCLESRDLTTLGSTDVSITLDWNTDNFAANNWQLSYSAVAEGETFDPEEGTMEQIFVEEGMAVNPYTVENLSAGTRYGFAIRQQCDDNDNGTWSNIIYTNTYGAATGVPYICDFEDATENNAWVISSGDATNYWTMGTAVTTEPISGTSMYVTNDGIANAYTLNSTSVSTANRLINFIDNEGGYKLSFDFQLQGESSYDFLKVFLVPDTITLEGTAGTLPTFATTTYSDHLLYAVGSTDIYHNLTGGVVHKDFFIPNPGDGVKKLVFVWRNDASSGAQPPAVIDNVSVSAISCNVPSDITVENVTTTSLDLVWTSDSPVTLRYREVDSTEWIIVNNLYSPYTMNTEMNTEFECQLQANCDADNNSFWSNLYGFSTPCESITELPWVEGFEEWTDIDPCWRRAITYTSGDEYPRFGDEYPNTGLNSIKFRTPVGGETYLATPMFDAPINTLTFEFYARMSATTAGMLEVGYMTNPSDAATFVSMGTVMPATTGTYAPYQFSFITVEDSVTGAFAIRQVENASTYSYFWVDDFTVDVIPQCAMPTGVAATYILPTSAEISWNPGNIGDSEWFVFYKASDSTTWNEELYAGEMPYVMTDLIPATNYDVKVATSCGGDYSDTTQVYTFRTSCDLLTVPTVIEEFNNVPPSACWEEKVGLLPATGNATLTGSSSSWLVNSLGLGENIITTHAKVNNYGTAKKEWLISPSIDLGQEGSISQIEFDLQLTDCGNTNLPELGGNDDKFAVVVSLDNGTTWSAASATIWTNEDGAILSYNGLATQQHVIIPLVDANENPYQGVVKIAFYAESTISNADNDIHIDNFIVTGEDQETPVCDVPVDLVAENITATTADLAWDGGTAAAWQVRIGEDGVLMNAAAEAYVLTDLSSNTVYTAYVRAICEDDINSEWASVNFTTLEETAEPCDAPTEVAAVSETPTTITVTWTGDAESYNIQYREGTAGSWNNTTATASPYTIDGLIAATDYQIQVQSVCESSASEWAPEEPVSVTTMVQMYTVTATAHGNGTIEPEGTSQYNAGATPIYTFTPDEGYIVDNLQVSGVETPFDGNQYQFPELTQDETIDVYFEINGTGIKESALANAIKLYPNPATNYITLVSDNVTIEKIEILDMTGRIVMRPAVASESILISNIEQGVYFARISTAEGVVTLRFVKQ